MKHGCYEIASTGRQPEKPFICILWRRSAETADALRIVRIDSGLLYNVS